MNRSGRVGLWTATLGFLFVVPFFLQTTRLAFLIRLGGIAGLYMLLALGLNLVVGFVGLLDLGFMAFYAIGAYTAALLSIQGWSFLSSTAAAILIAMTFRLA